MNKPRFYMVYLEGGNNPSMRHSTFEGAEREAQRLTRLYKKKAFVLMPLKSIELKEFEVEFFTQDSSDLPF